MLLAAIWPALRVDRRLCAGPRRPETAPRGSGFTRETAAWMADSIGIPEESPLPCWRTDHVSCRAAGTNRTATAMETPWRRNLRTSRRPLPNSRVRVSFPIAHRARSEQASSAPQFSISRRGRWTASSPECQQESLPGLSSLHPGLSASSQGVVVASRYPMAVARMGKARVAVLFHRCPRRTLAARLRIISDRPMEIGLLRNTLPHRKAQLSSEPCHRCTLYLSGMVGSSLHRRFHSIKFT